MSRVRIARKSQHVHLSRDLLLALTMVGAMLPSLVAFAVGILAFAQSDPNSPPPSES